MQTTYIYVLGAGSGVGKSTICLGLLAWLTKHSIPASELAYIKPITQCVDKQPVIRFCEEYGITCQAKAPLIFYQGYTRKFLGGHTADRNTLLDTILEAIRTISTNKRYVVIDGVGHPAVGSAVGITNATVITSLDNCITLFVNKPGIGAAIDSTVLCLTFLKENGIKTAGVLFNRVPSSDRKEVSSYLVPRLRTLYPYVISYGFLPDTDNILDRKKSYAVDEISDWFGDHVPIGKLLDPAKQKRH